MKKHLLLIFITAFCILASFVGNVSLTFAETEGYASKRIILGEFKSKKGFTASGSYSVPWLELEASHIAIDDNRKIYVLDKNKKRVLQFSPDGKLIKEIWLKDVDFSDKSEELGDEGYIPYQLKVSSNGSYLYITEGGKENNWAILDSNGAPIAKNRSLDRLERRCNDKFRSGGGAIELDNKLRVMSKVKISVTRNKNEIIDSENNMYFLNLKEQDSSKRIFLTKRMANGKQIWKKEIKNYNKAPRILGTDGVDNIYILTEGPMRIIKINNKGEQLASLDLPNDTFFRDWRFVNFSVLCDGTIYCIPTYFALWKGRKANDEGGEYVIYEFEKIKTTQ